MDNTISRSLNAAASVLALRSIVTSRIFEIIRVEEHFGLYHFLSSI